MLEILSGGFLTTVQDLGRVGFRRFGVSAAGAMDPFALSLANLLAGNAPDTAALEATMLGPELAFGAERIFALCGGDFGATLDGEPVAVNRACPARKNSVLRLGAARSGCRAYIAFSGGIDLPPVMGSRSTDCKGRFGGLEGRPLKAGDRLSLMPPSEIRTDGACVPPDFGVAYTSSPIVRAVRGPQDDHFSASGIEALFSGVYTVTGENDRMGYRLSGPVIDYREGCDGNIISDGLAMGCLQVSRGQPMVMMADCQTTGGYAKPAAVIAADLPLMAQLRQGDSVRFAAVTMREAQTLYGEQHALLRDLAAHLAAGGRGMIRSVSLLINGDRRRALVEES